MDLLDGSPTTNHQPPITANERKRTAQRNAVDFMAKL